MNDEKIKDLIKTGIKDAGHTQLVQAYRYVTKKDYNGGCTACFKRTAIRAVIAYYNKL